MRASLFFKCLTDMMFLLIFVMTCPARIQASPGCESLKTAQDLLICAGEKNPEMQRAASEVRTGEAAEKWAGQRPNPEMESRVLFGVADSENDVLSELNLYHPLELGGKRRARVHQAKAQTNVSRADQLNSLEQTIIETVLALHRLRQIQSEKLVLKENLSTYRRMENIYQRRPLLSPEQETALTVFNLNSQEAELEMSSLLDEENRLKVFLKTSIGIDTPLIPGLLPSPPSLWPQKESGNENSIQNWSQIKKAEAEIQQAEATLQSAKSGAWPTVNLGPSLETDSPLGDTKVAVGFALSTSLPFYQRNEGGKAVAQSEQQSAQLNLELVKKRGVLDLEKFIQEYQRNLKALKEAKALGTLEKKHREIESLFERGLIHGTLLLETHRQMFSLKQQYHRNELKALSALWNIYALEGRILEQRI